MDDFPRIKRLPPYIFSITDKLKQDARARGEDIVDFGMGNPDQATPQHIVDKLIESVQKGDTHRYSQSKGIPRLRKAICDWYERRFDVDLDPESEASWWVPKRHCAPRDGGSGPYDGVLVPNPSYPVHTYGAVIVDADVVRPFNTERRLSSKQPLPIVGPNPNCSSSTSRVTRQHSVSKSTSMNAWLPSRRNTRSGSCRISHMQTLYLMATKSRRYCRFPVRKTLRLSSLPCRRATTCRVGGWVFVLATPPWWAHWHGSSPIWITECSRPSRLLPSLHLRAIRAVWMRSGTCTEFDETSFATV